MTTQPEAVLENNLIGQLKGLGYAYVTIKDEADLLANLKAQLEKHNQTTLTDGEFKQVLNKLHKGNVFERSKILRDKIEIIQEDGTAKYIELIKQDAWCQNQYQVTNQVTLEGSYQNRYDVTLLVNGMPLVQIELKRRGLELKEAFNQVNRYQKHSFWSAYGLFQYVQLFVISNGVNTKYFANNKDQSFKQTFFWAKQDNTIVTKLEAFAEAFLEKCHLSKMITKYTVLNETHKILMVLRPYQYYATEAIIERVKNSSKNGYIWHTTGSGKTLTSFKTAQTLMGMPKVDKVVFVVDRNDLDYQTTKEFNSFQEGSVDSTSHTGILVDQFTGNYKTKKGAHKDTNLIVTTIQKLNNAVTNKRYLERMTPVQDERIVFIFDECHRSQFGKTHQTIKDFFTQAQLFGFTGTPIFAENVSKNAFGKRTTKDLFDECLHKYVITDAIKDQNVLKFSIEYVGRYKQKDESENIIDIEVEDIDRKELFESDDRIDKISDYIIANHNKKTHSREYSAMFCVSSKEVLIKYYEAFKAKKDSGLHDMRVVTIFSYGVNEDDQEADGLISDPDMDMEGPISSHSRDKLDSFIADYNAMYQTKYSTKDSKQFYGYYKDIAKRIKERELKSAKASDRVDLLLVVNMFLTGFDAKMVNTMYVDKNLKYHGLIQAFSRTNRILGDKKSQGNIVSFRNLKPATDKAITLFSNKDAIDEIVMQPYENYVAWFERVVKELKEIAPDLDSIDEFPSEEEELAFVKKFRELIRVKNVLSTFADFAFDDLSMEEQEFEDYKSKYLDIHDKVKSDTSGEKVSILNDIDFELELIHKDEINVAYILKLLADVQASKQSKDQKEKQKKQIMDLVAGEVQLRSKRMLIEQFINENLPKISDEDSLENHFADFWNEKKRKAFEVFCEDEKLKSEVIGKVIEDYLFSERKPLDDDLINALNEKPSLFQREGVIKRIRAKLFEFIELFVEGMSGVV
ncbi:type I restriction endonuclease subunit R [Reichenbachiella agariperforans]|uniref:type I restriction endonuclease subunit R n=1 Tax=Reichenbachiella agariperforans TaxID=156994 RepID=UPI001C08751F|nr:type I restriction endonuclease subunit R [Reichenbachiella agariperforans]MBU2912701.1 type I restriction endonuclease subunit R [Reichenbachiella agariperforans]